ncbi:hypothetical protein BHE74_00038402, partial [Ensete ventricosum]
MSSPLAGRLRTVAAHGSPAHGRRSRVARGRFFSRARRRSVSPRGEIDRGDVKVNGPETLPVYKFLKASKSGFMGNRIKWNFTKFLIDKEGKVIGRYGPTKSPLSIEVCSRHPESTWKLKREKKSTWE